MKRILIMALCVATGLSTVQAQNINPGYKEVNKVNHKYIKGSSQEKAGNCDETLSYYGNTAGIVSTTGNTSWSALIFIDPDELAFFSDSSAFGKIKCSIADSLWNGTDMYATYDSVYVEIYEGTTITGTGAGNTMTLGTLIYSKNITNEVIPQGITVHDMDSLIYFNKDTTYAIGVHIYQSDPAPCIGIDVGPSKQGKGAWIYTSGGNSFQRLDYGANSDNNWVISVCIDGTLIVPDNNLTITSATSNLAGYEIMNLNQAVVAGYRFSSKVKNNGLATATGVEASLNISPVNSTDQVVIGTVNAGQTGNGEFPTVFTPFLPGEHVVTYTVASDSVDFYLADNEFTGKAFLIDETRYGRVEVGNISPTPRPVYKDVYKGNMMNMYAEDTLKYIEAFLMDPILDAQIMGFCIRWDSAQKEAYGDTILTDTFTITQEIADFGDTIIYIPFLKHKKLDVGTYLFGLIEMDGASYMLPSNTRNYVPGTSFWTAHLASSGNWINTWVEEEYYYPVVMNFSNTYNTGLKDEVDLNGSIAIYPNPATGMINVSVNNATFSPSALEILDLTGRVQGVVNNINGKKDFSVNMSTYDAGVYIIRITDGKTSTTKRLVIK